MRSKMRRSVLENVYWSREGFERTQCIYQSSQPQGREHDKGIPSSKCVLEGGDLIYSVSTSIQLIFSLVATGLIHRVLLNRYSTISWPSYDDSIQTAAIYVVIEFTFNMLINQNITKFLLAFSNFDE
jgi:hypothetical protein